MSLHFSISLLDLSPEEVNKAKKMSWEDPFCGWHNWMLGM